MTEVSNLEHYIQPCKLLTKDVLDQFLFVGQGTSEGSEGYQIDPKDWGAKKVTIYFPIFYLTSVS